MNIDKKLILKKKKLKVIERYICRDRVRKKYRDT